MNEARRSPEPARTVHSLLPPRLQRSVSLLAAVAIGVALFGFLTGIREPGRPDRPHPPALAMNEAVPPAVTYAELPAAKRGPNANWHPSLAELKSDRPGVYEPVTRTEEMKLAALADRARNRAFDGAPPTIPHPVEARSAAACLACHGEGVKVGDRVASKVSHAHQSNCTQCHVEQSPAGSPFRAEPPSENAFIGVYRAGPGERASPGAPPTIPHRTWMRENCASCHGLVTRSGTRTTHPWLTNCTQCHAPSASLDQTYFDGDRK
jgi:cytochrome c-type protein NapB